MILRLFMSTDSVYTVIVLLGKYKYTLHVARYAIYGYRRVILH